ncbi:MAG: GNAT family N-acetyltransferase [Hyphomicrobiaceae bacterium]
MTAASPTITTRPAVQADMPAISELSARVFGPGRFVRTAYRVREGTPDVSAFCRVAMLADRIIAAIRMTEIAIGGRGDALLLGPLAVDPEFANLGHGRRLIVESAEAARSAGRELVLLVGDMPYYGRLGFGPVPPGQISLPGPVNSSRLLALELKADALQHFHGMVVART